MKQAKKPTRLQKKRMNPADWLVAQDDPEKMVLIHRHFDTVTKTIHKRSNEDA